MTIAPTSDIRGSGWFPSTAASPLYAMVDEADYIDSPVPAAAFQLSLA